jgi:hypothetical protein
MHSSASLLLAAAILSLSPSDGFSQKADALCDERGKSAEETMRARQNGHKLSDLMKLANKAGNERDHLRVLIKRAYRVPQYPTDELKDRVVAEFSNQEQLQCYDQYDKPDG